MLLLYRKYIHLKLFYVSFMAIEDRIRDIEEEIKKTPYNKATSHHIGKLKAKLSKLKEDALTRSSSGGKGRGFPR